MSSTTSPSYKLDVDGTIRTSSNVFLGGSQYGVPTVGTIGGVGDKLILFPGSATLHPYALGVNSMTMWYSVPLGTMHKWYINGTVGMTFSNFNLGIGTSSPSYKLDVSGNIRTTGNGIFSNALISDGGYGATYVGFQHNSLALNAGNYALLQSSTGDTMVNCASSRTIAFNMNNTNNLGTWTSSGLGVGTSSPSYKIHALSNGVETIITAENTSTTGWAGFAAKNNASGTYGGTRIGMMGNSWTNGMHYMQNGGFIESDGSNGLSIAALSNTGEIRLYSGGSIERARLSSNGNVGIGTTSPSYKLDVAGTIRGSQLIVGTNGTSNAIYFGGVTGDTPNRTFIMERLYDPNNGSNVTADFSELLLAKFDDAMVTYGPDRIRHIAGAHKWQVYPSGASIDSTVALADSNFLTAMYIDSNANVGIGHTAPLKNLHLFNLSNEVGIRVESGAALSAYAGQLFLAAKSNAPVTIAYYNQPLLIGRGTNGDAVTTTTIPTIVCTTGDLVGIGTSSPAYKLDVNGASRISGNVANTPDVTVGNMLVKTYNKSLTATALDFTNICTLYAYSGAYTFQLNVTHCEPGSGECKTYMGSVFYIGTNTIYYRLNPITSSGAYLGQDWTVEINQNHLTTTLRLVRLSGNVSTANFTCTLQVFQSQSNPVTITDSSTTGSSAANSGLWMNTQITQVNSNVGIGTESPSYKLHVVGDIYSTGNVTAYSDIRAKSNLEVINSPINKVSQLTGYTYEMISPPDLTTKITPRYTGIVAQDLEKVLPEAVHKDKYGNYSVAYGNMAGLFVEAIKDLSLENKELKKSVFTLEERISKLENIISTLM